MDSNKAPFGLVVHGGAGGVLRKNYSESEQKTHLDVLEQAVNAGYGVLSKGHSSLDAAIAAVRVLEDSPLYNAGKGAVYNAAGEHELDASVMDGQTKSCGGVGAVKTVKSPILLARKVMEDSPHTLMAAAGAEQYAQDCGLDMVENSYFNTDKRYQQYVLAKKHNVITLDHIDDDSHGSKGTVGAVALDQSGNIAAATSTGGLTHKMVGRIGDSAVIGAGTYADNDTAALSCTGTGDVFLAVSATKMVSDMMAYKGLSLHDAVAAVLNEIKLRGGDGGMIGITKDAEIIESFNTTGMFRGHRLSNGQKSILMFGDE